jgi:hypothetical protein
VFPSENEKTPMRKHNLWRRAIEPKLEEIKLKWATFQSCVGRMRACLERSAWIPNWSLINWAMDWASTLTSTSFGDDQSIVSNLIEATCPEGCRELAPDGAFCATPGVYVVRRIAPVMDRTWKLHRKPSLRTIHRSQLSIHSYPLSLGRRSLLRCSRQSNL